MAVFNIAGLKIDVHYGELPWSMCAQNSNRQSQLDCTMYLDDGGDELLQEVVV